MHTYTNPFYRPHYQGSKQVITTSVKPEEYKGLQIFKINAQNYDVVKDGALVAQMAGPNGARNRVDAIVSLELESVM